MPSRFHVIADDKTDIDEFVSNFKQWIYPSVPDKSEVGKFLNFLEMLPRHKKVLIIGSNPSLRDMAFLTKKDVTCCDVSLYKLESMKRNMKYGRYISNGDEQYIEMKENKIESPDKYDFILSIENDLNRLPFAEWDAFLREICGKLKSNGFFILKAMNKSNDDLYSRYTHPKQIVEDWMYSAKYKNDFSYLFVHLLIYLYHNNEDERDMNCVKWSDVMDLVSDEWEWNKDQKAEFFDKFGSDKLMNEYVFYCQNGKDTKTLLTRTEFFYLQQTCYGKDDDDKFKFTPIYVLGKQSNRTGGQPKVWGHATDDT